MDPLHERARRIRLLVLDVDGVLTDGRLWFGASGEELKVFHVRDGAGLVALQRAGVSVAIVSGRSSHAVERRAAELGIRLVRQGASDKAHEVEMLALGGEDRFVAAGKFGHAEHTRGLLRVDSGALLHLLNDLIAADLGQLVQGDKQRGRMGGQAQFFQ